MSQIGATLRSVRTTAASQFGVYEFDGETGELIKDGVRLPIQEQPAKVLRILLQRPGELITREQLKQVLAPDTSFGDFDHALNVAVAKLRTALNDSAEKPTYIETLHKRGYRFIAPVSGNSHAQMAEPISGQILDKAIAEPQKNRPNLKWWIASGIAALLLAATVVMFRPHSSASAVYEPVAFTTVQGQSRHPAFSPDGSEIAFTYQSDPSVFPRLYVQAVGSVVARPLTSDDAEPNRRESMPRWFHDGSRIAYMRQVDNNGPPQVWVVARSGGPPHKLAEFGPLLQFDIAPDDRSIVTSEGMPSDAARLYVNALDNSSRRELTHPHNMQWNMNAGTPGGDQLPLFSPDGRSVAFLRLQGSRIDLLQIPVAGGEPQRLLDDISSTVAMFPSYAWDADGKSLIVVVVRRQTSSWGRLWLPGKHWEPLAITGSAYPTLPRDGGRMAFMRATTFVNIWRYDLPRPGHSTAEPSNLTRSNAGDRGPSLSPDGSRLTFASNRTGNWEIYAANSDGSNPVPLTSFRGKDSGAPRWSPDGKQIAFDYRPDNHSRVFTIDANGGPARQMTFGDADDVMPRYSRDGKWIYFARLRQGGSDEWKLPNSGGAPVLVASDAIQVEESTDGMTLYIKAFGNDNPGLVGSTKSMYARRTGEKEQLLFSGADGATIGPFVALRDGIYYQQRSRHDHQLMFYEFATHRSRVVLQFPYPATAATTISISPDRHYYFEHKAEPQTNIMLIESFR